MDVYHFLSIFPSIDVRKRMRVRMCRNQNRRMQNSLTHNKHTHTYTCTRTTRRKYKHKQIRKSRPEQCFQYDKQYGAIRCDGMCDGAFVSIFVSHLIFNFVEPCCSATFHFYPNHFFNFFFLHLSFFFFWFFLQI